MTQPTFPDGPRVPLMVEGVLDATTLRQLAEDLTSAAEVRSVREKAAQGYASPDSQSVNDTIDRLLSGAVHAAQIEYRYDGHDWIDTVMRTRDNFRLVRCRRDD